VAAVIDAMQKVGFISVTDGKVSYAGNWLYISAQKPPASCN
jgi:hypothetical protein